MPLFLCFVLVLNAFIQIGKIELHLQTAVNETVKMLAADFYPAELLYLASKEKAERSKAGEVIRNTTGRIDTIRNGIIGAEDFVEQYRSFMPPPVIKLAEFEQSTRENLERLGKEEYGKAYDQNVRPAVNRLFTEIVMYYANQDVLKPGRLKVTDVALPTPGDHGRSKISIEAEYDYLLPVPFIHKTVRLKKRAVEWAWTGN